MSGGLNLNNANSKLLLNSITVDNVSTSRQTVWDLMLIITQRVTSSFGCQHYPSFNCLGQESLTGAITVTAGSLKLNETGTLASTIAMSGGFLDADESSTVSGALSHTADITIDVADNKTLTYSGALRSVLEQILSLLAEEEVLSAEDLTLNNASSKLLLNSITVDNVSTSADSLGLDVDADSTVTSLSVANINSGINCIGQVVSQEELQLTAGSLKLTEAGTLASTIAMSGGVLDADESLAVSGALSHSVQT